MTEDATFFERLWADLRRRHVVRVAIGYAVVAWALVEVAELILSAFDAPAWYLRAVVALAFLGFPVTVILAWVFDISERRIVVTASREFKLGRAGKSLLAAPLFALVALSGWWVWQGYVAERESTLRPTVLGERVPIVAVMPVRNLTGDPELDWYGEGLANLVRDSLTRSRFLRVVSPQRWHAIVGDATDPIEIAALSQDEGIGFILGGEMLDTPKGISVTTRLTDTEGGIVLSARQAEGLTPKSLFTAASSIATQVKQSLNVPHSEQVDIFAADFATNNLPAYESYIAGLGFFLNFQYRKALRSFEAALELAPDFAVARYRLAYLQAVLGQTEAAVRNMELALEQRGLADREQRYIEAGLALFRRDYAEAVAAYENLLRDYPFELEAREMLAKAYWGLYRADDAVRQLEELAAVEPQNQVTWSMLGNYLLSMGEFDRAQPALERFAELAPDNANSYALLGDSLRYRGEFDAALDQYQRALEIDPLLRDIAASLATVDYLRGDVAEAAAEFAAIADDERRSPRERLDAAFSLAPLQAATGDFAAAIATLERFAPQLVEEQIREAKALSMRALYEAERGALERARQLADEAISKSPGVPTRYLFARALLERRAEQFEAALATAGEIRSHALPADNPDRTEAMAADYIEGLVALARGDLDAAVASLRAATAAEGYRYDIYEVALAEALLQLDLAEEAAEALEAGVAPDLLEPRLDLEPTRVHALLVESRIRDALGAEREAAALVQRFRERFRAGPPGHPWLEEIRTAGAEPGN